MLSGIFKGKKIEPRNDGIRVLHLIIAAPFKSSTADKKCEAVTFSADA